MNCYASRATLAVLFAIASALYAQTAPPKPPSQQMFDGPSRTWLRQVRIAAYPLTIGNADAIVRQAEASGVYGIEVGNDIPGRYESLLDPKEKLERIRLAAAAAHRHRNKAFVYIAGLECISNDADGQHTLAKDHPQWLQRKITGQPAIFDAKAAFWIKNGEEDAWVSPYAQDWRALYMQRVRQIAATGIDGIYVDIPYWMTHFTGWEDTWASFDDATVAAFRRETGLDARQDLKLGDFQDRNFRKWSDFRVRTITDFLIEIRANATRVNPGISVIPEIFPGIEEEAPRVGPDVYQIYPHVDAIAHEYEFGGRRPYRRIAHAFRLADVSNWPAQFPCVCRRSIHLDTELFVGWRTAYQAARCHAQPRDVRVDGWRQPVGCKRACYVWFQRHGGTH